MGTGAVWIGVVLFLLLAVGAHATGIGSLPSPAERDMIFKPGLHRHYTLSVYGAETIDATLTASKEIRQYITLTDEAPGTGPRAVTVDIDFPDDAQVPPGIYGISFSANEVPSGTAQVSTSVSVSVGFTVRSYSNDPFLEIQEVYLTTPSIGERAKFTVNVISRTLRDIPSMDVDVVVMNGSGDIVAKGHSNYGVLPSTETTSILGSLSTENLVGGVYRTNVTVIYGNKMAYYDQAVLRVGTLTIDLVPTYTNVFTFNQTNKFVFQLKSNWNKPLTRVAASVNLLGQTKTSASTDILPFGASAPLELYFDRTETPPGPIEGMMTVTYQELNPDLAQQDKAETHTFTIPIHVSIVVPSEPIKAKTPWKPTTSQIVISIAVLLLVVNMVVVFLLLRKRPKEQQPASAENLPPAPR